MRILHIVEFGVRANGIGTVVGKLFNEQILLGHEIKIASISQNIAYKHLPLLYVTNSRDLKEIFASWRPEIVLFHSIWAMPYIAMAKLLRKEGIPYGVMMHGANSVENSKKGYLKKLIVNTFWFNSFLKNAACIIYLNNKEFENCVSKNLNKKNFIIPNGCDLVEIDINTKQIHKPVNVIYLGRLALYHKGIDFLLDALEILNKKGQRNFHLTFYGNENDIDIVKIKKRLEGLKSISHYAGAAYGDKKAEVYRNADMFILTSRFEGMPMGVLEALSYGVPCLLTPGTNMSDVVVGAHAGWETLCDAEKIASDIEYAIADLQENYPLYCEAAYSLSKNYDWKVIAKLSIEIFESIVSIQK